MIIDTSALIAIGLGEPETNSFERAIDTAASRLMSVASVIETAIVLQHRFGDVGAAKLDRLLARFPIEIMPVDTGQLAWARYALQTYGRGRHAAKLNFGDCFSYALAKSTGEPILFKGDDFSQTDLESASILYP